MLVNESQTHSDDGSNTPRLEEHVVTDVLFIILRLLPLVDLLHFALTSKHFKTLARHDYVWNKIIKEEFNTNTADTIISWGEHTFTIRGFPAYVARHQTDSPEIQYITAVLLKAKGIDVNLADIYGRTALCWAAFRGHTEIVQALLQAEGIDVNLADKYVQTPLYWAALRGHTKTVQALLKAEGIGVNLADNYGQTPLYWAEYCGHTETVQALLQAGGIDNLGYYQFLMPFIMPGYDKAKIAKLLKLQNQAESVLQLSRSSTVTEQISHLLRNFCGPRSRASDTSKSSTPFWSHNTDEAAQAGQLIYSIANDVTAEAIASKVSAAIEALPEENSQSEWAQLLHFIQYVHLPKHFTTEPTPESTNGGP